MNNYKLYTNLFVLSHQKAQEFYSIITNEEVPCICITNTNSFSPHLHYCKNRLNVYFDDVESWENVPNTKCIDDIIANKIMNFANQVSGPLVITCAGGVSRSAGVALGLSNIDSNMFPAYNRTCRSMIEKAKG